MRMFERLSVLYPNATVGDWDIYEENGQQVIRRWNTAKLGPQPAQATIDAVTDAQIDAAQEDRQVNKAFELSRKDKTLIKWIAQRTGGGTAASIRAELRAIWDATS